MLRRVDAQTFYEVVNALNQLLQETTWDAVNYHPLSGVTLAPQGAK